MKLRFGEVEVDPDARRILRAGRDVHLSGKALDLLILLLGRRPSAVSKAAIREHLWPDTFVSDANLPTLVGEIRAAIGDNAHEQHFIRTVHTVGYAFGGEASEVAGPGTPHASQPAGWLVGPAMRVAVLEGENILGREGADVIALGSSTVSRRHVRVTLTADGAVVEDLGSKNGTFVNDQRVTAPAKVVDGDQIRIGSLLFTFRAARAVTSTETV